MGIGISLILIAVGAVLTWAVNADVSGLDINTVGVILLVVGIVGLLLTLLLWSSWAPIRRREAVVEGEPGYVRDSRPVREAPARRRTTIVEHDDDVAPGPPAL